MNQRGIRGLAPIGRHQSAVGCGEVFGFDHRTGAAPEQFRAVGSVVFSDLVQLFDQIVFQLNQYLSTGHDHMLTHMSPS